MQVDYLLYLLIDPYATNAEAGAVQARYGEG